MGCGSSNVAGSDAIAEATPIQPTEPKSSTTTTTATGTNNHASGADGKKTADPVKEEKSQETIVQSDVKKEVGTSDKVSVGNPIIQAAVVAAHNNAQPLFVPPDFDTLNDLELESALDEPSSSFVGDLEIGQLVEYFTSGSCHLFSSDAASTLEISQANLAELCLIAGSVDDTIRHLKALESGQEKFEGMLELPQALHQQMRVEFEQNITLLSKELQKSMLASYDILSKQTCVLFAQAVIPTVITTATGGSTQDDEDAELDFNILNQQLLSTRLRLKFLSPEFLIYIVEAGTPENAPLILQHLSLAEEVFETPTALIRGVFSHRVHAIEVHKMLVSKVDGVREVPDNLFKQLPALERSLQIVEPSCKKLHPLIEPLIPTLNSLTPTMRHLQVYLSRFLPLLQESYAKAKADNVAPANDATTAQILQAYLIPFLKLMQPWLIQLRPYLGGLQPFFTELQPFLSQTHGAFSGLQPFLFDLSPAVQESAPFLLNVAFIAALTRTIHVLILLHPLMKQLHPLMQGLLEFIQELNTFLSQLQELLDLLQIYQTEPLEVDTKKEEAERESSKSSIARPWFDDEEEQPKPAADASQPQLTAPQFLSKNGKFLVKIVPYVSQLRPFANEVKEFVEKFVPFVTQLAPFYHDSLKAQVTTVLFYLVPIHDDHPATNGTMGSTQQAEVDEAALAKLLSS